MIQAGAFPWFSRAKKAPIQVVPSTAISKKSAGSISHVRPPNDSVIETSVAHAI